MRGPARDPAAHIVRRGRPGEEVRGALDHRRNRALLLLGLGGVGILVLALSGRAEKQTRSFEADPNSVPNVETATAAPPIPAVPTVKPVAPPKIAGTVPPRPSAAPTPTTPVTLGAFPRAQANNEVDRVTAGLASCKRAGDPGGAGSIRIQFEPDGRVATTLAKPFAGTSTGSCISSRYLAIRVGAFQGAPQQLSRTFVMAGASARPSDPGF